MLVAYSLGLGVPFVVAGVAFGRLTGVLAFARAHLRAINLVSGLLLAGLGVLLLTDNLHVLSTWFSDLLERPRARAAVDGVAGASNLPRMALRGRSRYRCGGRHGPRHPLPLRCRPGWAAFPSWQASTWTWPGARSSCSRAPTGPARPASCEPAPGCCESSVGEAVVLGADLVAHPRAVRRRVGLLGHASALYDDLSATDNVRFAVRAAAPPVTAAGPALERLGLRGRLPSTPVGALSAGQRRRVALAVLAGPRPRAVAARRASCRPRCRAPGPSRRAWSVTPSAAVRPWCMASHEHDRAAGSGRSEP